jgi:hypothetical protein
LIRFQVFPYYKLLCKETQNPNKELAKAAFDMPGSTISKNAIVSSCNQFQHNGPGCSNESFSNYGPDDGRIKPY